MCHIHVYHIIQPELWNKGQTLVCIHVQLLVTSALLVSLKKNWWIQTNFHYILHIMHMSTGIVWRVMFSKLLLSVIIGVATPCLISCKIQRVMCMLSSFEVIFKDFLWVNIQFSNILNVLFTPVSEFWWCSKFISEILDTPWLIVIISVIIFALFCLIIAMCCRYKNNEDRRRKARRGKSKSSLPVVVDFISGGTYPNLCLQGNVDYFCYYSLLFTRAFCFDSATRLRHQHEDNYDMMPAVSGRRMQPVSSRQQRTPSQVGQDPRSPGVNSPPSPFNPEMMPFIACSPYGQSGHSPYQAQSSGSSPHPGEGFISLTTDEIDISNRSIHCQYRLRNVECINGTP